MSEKLNKFRRKYQRAMKAAGVEPLPKREPMLTHSNALCETGRHDFARVSKRKSVRKDIKDGLSSTTVWDREPRVKTCRQCATKQVQATTGQWITVR